MYRDGVGGPEDLHLAALYYQRASSLGFNRSRQLNKLKRHHPLEIAPWGRWLPDDVHQAMREWMLMAHRLRFPKPLRITVAEYICTSSGW